jgi:hypothetical protein
MRDNAIERGVSIGRDQNQFVSLIVNITDFANPLLSEVPRIGFLEYVHALRPWLGRKGVFRTANLFAAPASGLRVSRC